MTKNSERVLISDPQTPRRIGRIEYWVGVNSDTGIVETFHRYTTMKPVIIGGLLYRVEKRGAKRFQVRYAISPITPVTDRSYFWLDEVGTTPFDGVM